MQTAALSVASLSRDTRRPVRVLSIKAHGIIQHALKVEEPIYVVTCHLGEGYAKVNSKRSKEATATSTKVVSRRKK
jgi:hypothetical protein